MLFGQLIKMYGLFAGLGLGLNFVWESWHAVYLYDIFGSGARQVQTGWGFTSLISYAALMDGIILTIILLGGAMVWRKSDWFLRMNRWKYVYFVGVSVLWAAAIEYKAVFLWQQWRYSDRMPTWFGLGVSPLLQLAATGLLALGIVRYKYVRREVNSMVQEIEDDGVDKFYRCEECGLKYRARQFAKRCQDWCREHKSCNLDIIKQAEVDKGDQGE